MKVYVVGIDKLTSKEVFPNSVIKIYMTKKEANKMLSMGLTVREFEVEDFKDWILGIVSKLNKEE